MPRATSLRGPGYKEAKMICRACLHVFERVDYEEDYTYFCIFRHKGQRPLCGSLSMEESFSHRADGSFRPTKVADLLREKWKVWVKGRAVAPWGSCWAWTKKKPASK